MKFKISKMSELLAVIEFICNYYSLKVKPIDLFLDLRLYMNTYCPDGVIYEAELNNALIQFSVTPIEPLVTIEDKHTISFEVSGNQWSFSSYRVA
ncbi:hypothetical protein [Sinanaerobacter sp. ZZT-01]|uniref:hypothetical protein n=1 Tax=Sinanaerobacter sp. ZZT-01 TaxID=3111540 RepID=UPI002D79DDEC|nr:hypothetical protein [Sinanaerobacter sp. ZZT-01]WRR92670.1 hypothetical protein U5921_11535 [Sinanaerobacter sp. ZZT-01]